MFLRFTEIPKKNPCQIDEGVFEIIEERRKQRREVERERMRQQQANVAKATPFGVPISTPAPLASSPSKLEVIEETKQEIDQLKSKLETFQTTELQSTKTKLQSIQPQSEYLKLTKRCNSEESAVEECLRLKTKDCSELLKAFEKCATNPKIN